MPPTRSPAANRRTFVTALASSAVLAALAAPAAAIAQDVPRGPIRIVVPYPPGAATDAIGRLVAAQLATRLDRQVIVENKPGSGTIIGTGYVARAAPDGNTLLFTVSTHATNPAIYRQLPYDTLKDFSAVGLVGTTPALIAVHPSVPAKDVRELVALAKADPQRVKYGTAGHGSPTHLIGELLGTMAGAKMLHVPYRGGAPAMADAVGGHIPMIIGALPTVAPNVQAGRLRAVAVTSRERSSTLPDTQTVAEAGFPDFDVNAWYVLLANAQTPRPTLQRLNGALGEALADPAFRDQLLKMGVTPGGDPPEEVDRMIQREIALWTDLVEKNRIEKVE
jgi:tripartite-type tricarboxylate transporter receptor subunit TctC